MLSDIQLVFPLLSRFFLPSQEQPDIFLQTVYRFQLQILLSMLLWLALLMIYFAITNAAALALMHVYSGINVEMLPLGSVLCLEIFGH